MRVVFLLACVCLPALLQAKPSGLDARTLVENYARSHPNIDTDEPECEILNEEEVEEIGPLNAIVDKSKKWTKNVLNYNIVDDSYGEIEKEAIRAAVEEIQRVTSVDGKECITFRETSSEWNRVVIKDCGGRTCSSYIGMTGREQRMCLAPRCFKKIGTLMHEFLHALGFHHEHRRADRDSYVYVNFDNIRSGAERYYQKLVEGKSVDHLGTKYDYGSIMHYSAYSYAKDPTVPTMVPLDADGIIIGQDLALSDIDIERVQILYGCKDPSDSKYFKHLAGKL